MSTGSSIEAGVRADAAASWDANAFGEGQVHVVSLKPLLATFFEQHLHVPAPNRAAPCACPPQRAQRSQRWRACAPRLPQAPNFSKPDRQSGSTRGAPRALHASRAWAEFQAKATSSFRAARHRCKRIARKL